MSVISNSHSSFEGKLKLICKDWNCHLRNNLAAAERLKKEQEEQNGDLAPRYFALRPICPP